MAHVVGIDLGTTHTVLAYADRSTGRIVELPVRQYVGSGVVDREVLLPSCLYAPLDDERDALGGADWLVGRYARTRGAEVPERQIVSAKSWLCHAHVDRHAPILPWIAQQESGPRLSPVEASARILRTLVETWNEAFANAPLTEQDITLTVPASFDEVARALTLHATELAGFDKGRVRLLEEPQAALLDWVERVGSAGLEEIAERGEDVLVCDIGGGTTDLSLVAVSRNAAAQDGIGMKRVAVGDHLLLGGDNLDLAIARLLEPKLTEGAGSLTALQFAQLVANSRSAKERLLSRSEHDGATGPLAEATVALLSRGGRLVGQARKATLHRAELDAVLDAFFPALAPEELADGRTRARSALTALGLPYASDAAITRHLGRFLLEARVGRRDAPLAVLFNGGVFHAEPIVQRVCIALERWIGRAPRVLPHRDPDRAVARGAVAYGRSLRGPGRRIGGGAARSFFVGLGANGEGPNAEHAEVAVCVLERGTEVGVRTQPPGRYALTLGRTARFPLFAATHNTARVGDRLPVDEQLERLLPLVTTVQAADASGELAVRLEAELTELGTLDVDCVEATPAEGRQARRFRLGFWVRGGSAAEALEGPTALFGPRLEDARARIERVFGKAQADVSPRTAKDLLRDLERLLGPRDDWPLALVRALFDSLVPLARARRRTADHERSFWQLAGFLLRPGFGAVGDDARALALDALWKEALSFPAQPNGWRTYWIAWRRIAGGLSAASQERIREDIEPLLALDDGRPKRRPKHWRPEPFAEFLAFVASLERVAPAARARLGALLLERTWTSQDPALYAALGRMGARVPSYAERNFAVPARVAEGWLTEVLRTDWQKVPSAPYASVLLARRTGDRAYDIGDPLRMQVLARLSKQQAPAWWLQQVREVVELDQEQRVEQLGDALPPGLRLARER